MGTGCRCLLCANANTWQYHTSQILGKGSFQSLKPFVFSCVTEHIYLNWRGHDDSTMERKDLGESLSGRFQITLSFQELEEI